MCFVLWLLFFGGRCGHLLLLLSSIICFSSAEGMVSSSSEHILGLCICICICVWRYWWWCVTSALQLIRAHSWLPSLRRMLLTPRGFPRLVSRWYVTHQIKPTSHPIQLSNYPTIQVVQLYKPRTRYVTHPIQPIRRLISALSLAPFIIISIRTTDGDVYLADSAHVPQVHV